MYRFRRLQHRTRQRTSQSDDDGSESEECIDISSSSSNDHPASDSSSSNSSVSISSSSDSESDEEDCSSAGNDYECAFIGGNEVLDRTTKMLQHLNRDELKRVQIFINSLDATNTDKLPTLPTRKKTSQKDLSQQAITPTAILSVGLQYVGFDFQRQASASKDLNIERLFSSFSQS